MEGAIKNGVEEAVAQTIFEQLRGFGAYSFAKSHAASFAVLTYQSAWFKYYHPAIFYAAILNHQPMGFWSPSTLVYDAMRQGISVLPPDINRSAADCSIEAGAIRIGLSYVKGLKSHRLDTLLATREQRPFADLQDFVRRARLPLRLIERPDSSRGAGRLGRLAPSNCFGMLVCSTKRVVACRCGWRCRLSGCPSQRRWNG